MVTVYTDVPFETDDEVSSRLAHYEELFSNRYTKEDDWYSRTCQRTGRCYQVPVMNPWPPKKVFNKKKRYEDLDSGPHRRGGYYSDRRNRDRSGHGYAPRDKYVQHEPHSYGHSGWGHNSRSPRGGYYGNEGYGRHSRSPHRSPSHYGASWDHAHSRQPHPSTSPPSHHSQPHHRPPHTHQTDHTQYDYQHEQPSLKSRSPGSFTWQSEQSPPEQIEDVPAHHYSDQQPLVQHSSSPNSGNDSLLELQHSANKGEADVTVGCHGAIGTAGAVAGDEDVSSQSETDTNSVKMKAPPPPPLDLSSVIGSEDEQKLVPSQSDVMDILSIASKGSNEVTSENLRQVQRETQIQAARKTMKSRDRHEKGSSGKSSSKTRIHKESHRETASVSHGHTKSSSHSRSLEGGSSSKPLSKTHALLQESIAAAEAEKSSRTLTVSAAKLQEGDAAGNETSLSVLPTGVEGVQSGSRVKGQGKTDVIKSVAAKKKHKRRKAVKREICSSSENEELDVVTPDGGSASLSVSLRRDLMTESGSHVQQTRGNLQQDSVEHQRRHSQGKITLSVDDLASDVSDVDDVMDTITPKATSSSVPSGDVPLWVRIDREQISKSSLTGSQHSAVEGREGQRGNSASSLDSPSYAVEYNPKKLTKMVIRTQPLEGSVDEDYSNVVDHEGDTELRRDVGGASTAKKAKKKKKKHKKITMGEDLKLKITL